VFVYACEGVQGCAVDVDGKDFRAGIQVSLDAGLTDALSGGSDEHSLTGEVHVESLVLIVKTTDVSGLKVRPLRAQGLRFGARSTGRGLL
jgi:hypothetical protein